MFTSLCFQIVIITKLFGICSQHFNTNIISLAEVFTIRFPLYVALPMYFIPTDVLQLTKYYTSNQHLDPTYALSSLNPTPILTQYSKHLHSSYSPTIPNHSHSQKVNIQNTSDTT